jgi:hypothetical protein
MGLTLLALIGAFFYRVLWEGGGGAMKERITLAILVVCWLAAGLYNPLLFNPIAGINYSAFAILASLARKEVPIT